MLQGQHSEILLTFIKLPFVIKIFVLSIFEWEFYTGFSAFTIKAANNVDPDHIFLLDASCPGPTVFSKHDIAGLSRTSRLNEQVLNKLTNNLSKLL